MAVPRSQLVIGGLALGLVTLGVLVVLGTRRGAPVPRSDGKLAPIELAWVDAEAYLRRLGYPSVEARGPMIVARDAYCATDADCRARRPKMTFQYDAIGGERPRCVTVTHSYALDWKSIVQKLTGVMPSAPTEVLTGAGPLRLQVTPTSVSIGC
jgi:hypothetical protein